MSLLATMRGHVVRFGVFPLIWCGTALFTLTVLQYRLISATLVVLALIAYVYSVRAKRLLPFLIMWFVATASLFSPFDISTISRRGHPRVVPLVMGLVRTIPGEKPRDEAVYGGCLVSGVEPRYILIW